MLLEKELHQTKPFISLKERTLVNIMFTYQGIASEMKSFFSKYGITQKQYNILRILHGAEEPVSTSYLKERLLDRHSDCSRMVDRMVSKGFVIKNPCKHDKRLVNVSISDKGVQKLERVTRTLNDLYNMFDNLDQSEMDELNQLLDKLRG